MTQTEVGASGQPLDAITREDPGLLRAVAVGCAVGVTAVFVAVGGAIYLSQRGIAAALALGAMSAIWGGLGFGAMFGGVLHLARHSEEPSSATRMPSSEQAHHGWERSEVPPTGRATGVPLTGSAQVAAART